MGWLLLLFSSSSSLASTFSINLLLAYLGYYQSQTTQPDNLWHSIPFPRPTLQSHFFDNNHTITLLCTRDCAGRHLEPTSP
jgi:hypothetical protein